MSFNRMISGLAIMATIAAGACGKSNSNRADTALQTDLSLAQQQQQHFDSLSPAEANGLTTTNAAVRPTTAAPAPSTRRVSTTTHRTTSRSSGTRSSGTSSGTVSTTTASSGGEVVVKHTQRDAAIGAAAGAVIGATTSRNKVKGGLIGAAVGGILGGVIGNNVDKQKKPPM